MKEVNNTKVNNNKKNTVPIKKKKHGCRNCFFTMLVFVVIIGVSGYFVGDYYAKQYLGVGAGDIFGILWDVRYTGSKDKIVTNSYSDEDLRKFNNEIKKQLFLKDSVDLDSSELIESVIKGMNTPTPPVNNPDKQINTQIDRVKGYLPEKETTLTKTIHLLNDSGVDETPNEMITYITNLFIPENIDKARLNEYDETKHETDYLMSVSDKSFAALINSSLDLLLRTAGSDALSALKEYGIENIIDVVGLEQVIFEQETGEGGASYPIVKVTLSLKVKHLVMTALEKQVPGVPAFLISPMLPSVLYATAAISLDPGYNSQNPLKINNMTDKQMEKIYTLVSSIGNLRNAELDLKKMINDTVDSALAPILETIAGYINIDFTASHALNMDMFEVVINALKFNEGKEDPAEILTSKDIIKTLSGVISSEAENAIKTDHAWDNQYLIDGKVVYNPVITDEGSLIDYKQEFLNEISAKYLLDLRGVDKDDPSDDITFDDIMELFGISGGKSGSGEIKPENGGSGEIIVGKDNNDDVKLSEGGDNSDSGEKPKLDLLDLLDPKKLSTLNGMANRSVLINDRMLGAILNAQIDTIVGGGAESTISQMQPKLEYLILSSTQNDTAAGTEKHNFIEMGLSVNVASLMGDVGGGFGTIISNLIGKKVVLVVKMDITPVAEGEEFTFEETTIGYNDLNGTETARILSTIKKFGLDFDTSSLLLQLETPLRDAMKQMSSILPVKLCDSSINLDETFKDLPSAIELPSVYHAIDMFLFKDDANDVITPNGIEQVLTGVDEVNKNGFDAEYITNPAHLNYNNFMNSIEDKYYIKPQYDENEQKIPLTFDMLFGENSLISSKDGVFSTDNFNFNGKGGLFYDTRTSENLKPTFYDNELAALMKEKMLVDESYGTIANIRELTTSTDGNITFIVEVSLTSLLGSGNEDKIKLLPADRLMIKATIDTHEVKYYLKDTTGEDCNAETPGAVAYYKTDFTINNMSDTAFNVLDAMLKHLNGGTAAFDFDSQKRSIGSMVYEQFNALEDNLGGKIEFVSETVTEGGITSVKNGIKIISFYDFLKIALKLDPQTSTQLVKSTIQGLMPYNEEMYEEGNKNDKNYKIENIVVNNIISADDPAGNEHKAIKPIGTFPMYTGANIYGTDRFLGGILAAAVNKENLFELVQLNIIDKDDEQNMPRINEYVKNIEDYAEFTTFLEFTFKMYGFAGSGDLSGIIPNEIYVSIILPYNNSFAGTDKAYGEITYRINDLSKAENDLLMDIIGINKDITDQLDVVKSALSDACPNAKFYKKGEDSTFKDFDGLNFMGYVCYEGKLEDII